VWASNAIIDGVTLVGINKREEENHFAIFDLFLCFAAFVTSSLQLA
jgi:hypothetical protein